MRRENSMNDNNNRLKELDVKQFSDYDQLSMQLPDTPFLQNKYNLRSLMTKDSGFLDQLFKTISKNGWLIFIAIIILGGSAVSIMPFILVFMMFRFINGKSSNIFSKIGEKRLNNKLINTYLQYAGIIGDAKSFSIEWLAKTSGQKINKVRANLELMRSKGLLMDKFFSEDGEKIFLTDNAIEAEYVELNTKEEVYEDPDMQRAMELYSEGMDFIKKIEIYNNDLPDREITDELDKITKTLGQLYGALKKKPSSYGKIRKINNYYIPELLNLLGTYTEMYHKHYDVSNSVKIREEIEEAVHMLNEALNNLYTEMMDDTEMNVSADINVMKNMLKQDGMIN
ncbi:MAG: hypothetical protein K6B41_06120 [Butyrivibrio sp.]|nr:hypothetical protein [Butyrivibrio sp.]